LADLDCSAGNWCDGNSCAAQGANGAACGVGNACLSGNCADGVCCDTACGSECQACTAAKTGGSDGVCDDVTLSTDPDDECSGGACNGVGSCALDQGQLCAAGGQCLSGNCADGFCCDAACDSECQACSVAKTITLASGTCGSIPAGSDPDDECVGGACNGAGVCVLGGGQACTLPTECLSGNCVDGFCCDTACGGTCEACDIGGIEGSCAPIAAAQDPDSECVDGACNGSLACASDAGIACTNPTDCLSTHCVDGVCCDAACSGNCEACTMAKTASPDGTCAAVTIATDPDDECSDGACDGAGVCISDDGQSCGGDSECLSGFCADGVCCESACDTPCEQCNANGTEGQCTLIPQQNDPDDECSDGACDGNGACAADLGQVCTMGDECLSGSCVDGVCCNNACDGVCEQCDASGDEGTCTPLGVDTECRASASECDAAESCDGTSGDCPADAGEPDGAACSDGVCEDGSCVPDEGSGGSGATPSTGGGGQGGVDGSVPPAAEGGCGCRTAGQQDDDARGWLLLLALGLATGRRRRTPARAAR
jgi:MYXO-CTERM domain-containing protein